MLRAAVYEHAQQEKPAGVPRYKWDGSVMEGDSLKSGAGKDAKMDPQKAPEEGMPKGVMPKDAMKKLQETFFKGLDRNKDGKLSREEMVRVSPTSQMHETRTEILSRGGFLECAALEMEITLVTLVTTSSYHHLICHHLICHQQRSHH